MSKLKHVKCDLKPCPFCGCYLIDIRTRKTTIIECIDCEALFIEKSRRTAIKRWNTRYEATGDES